MRKVFEIGHIAISCSLGLLSERETPGGLGVGMLFGGSVGGLGWAFAERAIIRQEPPDDACHVAGDND